MSVWLFDPSARASGLKSSQTKGRANIEQDTHIAFHFAPQAASAAQFLKCGIAHRRHCCTPVNARGTPGVPTGLRSGARSMASAGCLPTAYLAKPDLQQPLKPFLFNAGEADRVAVARLQNRSIQHAIGRWIAVRR